MTKANGRKPKNIKHHNLRYILSIVKRHGVCTAGEISRESNLSMTTIVKTLDSLKQAGIVKSIGKGNSTSEGGKRPELFGFNERFRYVLCVYFAGKYAMCTLNDLSNKGIAARQVYYKDASDAAACMGEAHEQLCLMMGEHGLAEEDICGISLGIDGIVDSEKNHVVYPIHNPQWKTGGYIVECFRTYFPGIENIQIENSGRLGSWNYLNTYPELESERVVVLNSSESLTAGALLQNNTVQHGGNCLIGEFAHMMIPNAKGVVECECGRKNCFEKLIALERFEGYVLEMIDSKEEAGLYRKLCGHEIEPLDMIRLADEGSAAGRKALDLVIEYYLSVICNLMITCDPRYYVIGGIYVRNSEYFRRELSRKFEENTFWGIQFKTRILYDMDDDGWEFKNMARPVINTFLNTLKFDE